MAKNKITNLGQLNQSLQTKQGAATLMSMSSIKKQLEDAGTLMRQLLEKHIQGYYDSYEPQVYERTFALINSVRLEPVQQIGNQFSIRIYLDPETATHPSVMGGEPGYTPTLISQGWEWSDQSNPIHRFTHFEGYDFVQMAIEDFNKQNRWGFKVTKNVK